MEYPDFEAVVLNLYGFFNYKNPASAPTIEQWFARVKHIPFAALGYIERWMQDERDSMPRNVAKAFNRGWFLWQAANPQVVVRPRTACDSCGGKGFVWYAKRNIERGSYETKAALCGACENYQRTMGKIDGLRMETRERLELDGLAVFPSKKYWEQIQPEGDGGK